MGLSGAAEYELLRSNVDMICTRLKLGRLMDDKEYAIFTSLLERVDELERKIAGGKTNV